jgi:hypothetical protein
MATLAQTIKKTKGLEQIAQQVKNVALFYAPKDTGNLKREINKFNRAKNMVSVVGSGTRSKIKIDLDVSPPGAEYGKWFQDPPKVIKRRKFKQTAIKRGNWQFGKKALKDKSVKNEIKKFTKEFATEFKRFAILEIQKFRFT